MKKLLPVLFWLTTVSMALAQEEKWTELFNGDDLTGWKQLGGYAKYFVDKGEIVGMIVNNTPNTYLCTEKEYDDFILEVDIKLNDPMWGGLQFRSQSTPDYQNGLVHGYQMEVDPSGRGRAESTTRAVEVGYIPRRSTQRGDFRGTEQWIPQLNTTHKQRISHLIWPFQTDSKQLMLCIWVNLDSTAML